MWEHTEKRLVLNRNILVSGGSSPHYNFVGMHILSLSLHISVHTHTRTQTSHNHLTTQLLAFHAYAEYIRLCVCMRACMFVYVRVHASRFVLLCMWLCYMCLCSVVCSETTSTHDYCDGLSMELCRNRWNVHITSKIKGSYIQTTNTFLHLPSTERVHSAHIRTNKCITPTQTVLNLRLHWRMLQHISALSLIHTQTHQYSNQCWWWYQCIQVDNISFPNVTPRLLHV